MPQLSPHSVRHLEQDADVIVVGAGPGGSTAAAHLARAGRAGAAAGEDDLPAGEGLRRRAHPTSGEEPAQPRASTPPTGRRTGACASSAASIGSSWTGRIWRAIPSYGLVRPRVDFDEVLARTAQKSGAILREATTVSGPLRDERTGRIVGVTIKDGSQLCGRRSSSRPMGCSARTALGAGIEQARRPAAGRRRSRLPRLARPHERPLPGVAPRALGRPARRRPAAARLRLDLRRRRRHGQRRPRHPQHLRRLSATSTTRTCLRRWLSNVPDLAGVELSGPVRGGALPMGFNRQPHYRDGLLLIGDAAGAVNPFNGEGIAYAMETAETAADIVIQALARPAGPAREQALVAYPAALSRPLRRLLHAGTLVRRPDRPSRGDEGGHQVRAAAPDLDALHPKVAGEPHRPARR